MHSTFQPVPCRGLHSQGHQGVCMCVYVCVYVCVCVCVYVCVSVRAREVICECAR
jgi:hypothetical protein